MPTPHNAANKGDIAKVVLMPGDPLRAKFVAQNYLQNVTRFSSVRNMLGFTGTYGDVPVSVMGSGMGIPSAAIYSWELYSHYDVDAIIRIGSTGGLAPQVKVRDIVIAQGACTDSNFAHALGLPDTYAPIADFGLLRQAVESCETRDLPYYVGNVVSTDAFYGTTSSLEEWAKVGVLGVEMEAAGLYMNAAKVHKKALGIMTVSDLPLTGESLDSEQREKSFTQMMEVALDVVVRQSQLYA